MGEIVTTLVIAGVKKLGSALWNKFVELPGRYAQDIDKLEETLQTHLTEAGQWSTVHQIRGMSNPEDIDSTTIELSMDSQARQFRTKGTASSAKSESQILADPNHYLILGEPGAGKTTTLRRLVRTVLLNPPEAPTDTVQYPIVLPLRDLKTGTSLYTKIADLIGIFYKSVEIKKRVQSGVDRHGKPEYEDVVENEVRVGEIKIENAVPDILNLTNAIVFLDGIDELRADQRGDTLQEIKELGRKLNPSRIITSSRSGDYTFNLPGFCVVEMQPLDAQHIRSIAEKWLPNPAEFLASLKRLTYYEVANRPLLLTHLLLIYQRDQSLPRRPVLIYNRVLRLLLEDWDRERGIRRSSKYAGFDPDRKREFLAALSYQLTYRHEKKVFSEEDLIQAYEEVRNVFGLPTNEARKVAREIQTHTGIIAAAGDSFEFSHLTLQEYLCAEHMVRLPGPLTIPPEHAAYPAPLAITIALSSAPGLSFARIFLGRKNVEQLGAEGTASFLLRLRKESPDFERSQALGVAMLKLYMMANRMDWRSIREPLDEVLGFDRVTESIADALDLYIVTVPEDGRHMDYLLLSAKRDAKLPNDCDFPLPPKAALPAALLPGIVAINPQVAGQSKTRRNISIGRDLAKLIAGS